MRSKRTVGWVIGGGFVVALACSSTETPVSSSSTGLITVANGGVIRTADGIVLEVPPDAVTQDVEVTVTRVDAAATSDPSVFIGARFEPDGLVLRKAAKLTLPLTNPTTSPPLELVFAGSDPREAVESGLVADVSDGKNAVLSIWHFSGNSCAVNCHGGTREFLTKQLAARGLDLTACVTAKYPNSLPAHCEDLHSDESAQAILGTFFDELPSCCDEGQEVSEAQLEQLRAAVAQGRNVVVGFARTAFGSRGGPNNFYPAMNHTATVELVNGVPMLRNSVVIPRNGGAKILEKLGGTNVVYWPLADLNGFRRLKAGVGLELATCGTPGCLGNDQGGPFTPLAVRPVPWSAVRLFVERATPPSASSCKPADAGAADSGTEEPCPEYHPTVGYCSGENNCPPNGPACACGGEFCCTPGFCWTRDIAGCQQEKCPPGVGRHYNDTCACDAPDTAVYDRCRSGFMTACIRASKQ